MIYQQEAQEKTLGTRYSIKLYFPTEKIEHALLATAEIADKPETWINVILPNNRKVLVPFFPEDQTRSRIQIGQSVTMDTILLFPVDGVVQEYITVRKNLNPELQLADILTDIDGESYCSIGTVWLIITSGSKYTEFNFAAASSSFNEIFLKSQAAHQQFLKVLNAANGVTGLIDVETRRYHLLYDPSRTIYINHNRYYLDGEYGDGIEPDIDQLTEAIKSKISNL